MNKAPINFSAGAHSETNFAAQHLTPHFESGVIVEFPGARYYAICYGELCAYGDERKLLAIWSAPVPDCAEDEYLYPNPAQDYIGLWSKR